MNPLCESTKTVGRRPFCGWTGILSPMQPKLHETASSAASVLLSPPRPGQPSFRWSAEHAGPRLPLVIHRLPDSLRYEPHGRSGPARPPPPSSSWPASLETMRDDGHFNALRAASWRGPRFPERHAGSAGPRRGPPRGRRGGAGGRPSCLAPADRPGRGSRPGISAARPKRVLDELIRQGKADPARIGAFGISRGGYLAFHLAAADPRIRFAAAMSPLIEPHALTEFAHDPQMVRAQAASALRIAPKLAGRPIWIGISNDDMRVDVDRVIAFARSVVRASAAGKEPNPGDPGGNDLRPGRRRRGGASTPSTRATAFSPIGF